MASIQEKAGHQNRGQKKGWFTCFAQKTAMLAGSAGAFATAIGVVAVWALTGPLFHFSDVWQLVINTGTTIVTCLMVFLVQNAQNRDGKVIQLKLDELLRAVETAKTAYINMDNMSEAELEALRLKYSRLAQWASHHKAQPEDIKTSTPDAEHMLESTGV